MSFRDPRLNRKHEEAMVELGRWVRTRRESLGVTQEELAEAIDTSQRYVSRFELGQIRSLPNAATLGRLASVLDCTMQDLLVVAGYVVGDRPPAEPEPEDDVAVFTSLMRGVNRLQHVSEHDKRVIAAQIDLLRRLSIAEAGNEDEP